MKTSIGMALTALLALSSLSAEAQNKGTIRLGVEIPASIVNVPMFMTVDRLKPMGYDVKQVQLQSPETMTLALQNREVDIIGTSVGTAFSAIDAAFDGKAFLGMASSDFLMVARQGLTTCESLDGKRVAVQSREERPASWRPAGSRGTAGTTEHHDRAWIEPRHAGLIAGQLDRFPIDSQNTAQLMALKPESSSIPSRASARMASRVGLRRADRWLDQGWEMMKILAKTYVDVLHEAHNEPQPAPRPDQGLLANTDPKIVEAVVDSWLRRDVFVPVWGMERKLSTERSSSIPRLVRIEGQGGF